MTSGGGGGGVVEEGRRGGVTAGWGPDWGQLSTRQYLPITKSPNPMVDSVMNE